MKIRQIIITVVALSLIGASLFLNQFLASQKEEPKKREAPESVKYVRTEAIKYNDIQTEIRAFGRLSSAQPIDMIAEVSGKVLKGSINLKEGQNFQKGSVLFRIDDTEARLNLQSSKSNFLKSVASILADFKLDFPERYEEWSGYFQKIDVTQPLPELPNTQSAKEKTYLATRDIFTQFYTIQSTEKRLSKYVITAPYTGSVAELILEIGSFVNVGGKVARIVRTDKLELKVPVESSDVQWIQKGAPVTITTENGLQEWKGNVSRIADVVNTNTQSIDVFINVFPNQYPVFDGLYLKANIPGSIVKNAMMLPRNAVFDNNRVYVVEQDSVLREKQVDVHKINRETIIFSGLPENADLVFEPLVNAYSGMKVKKLKDSDKFMKLQTNEKGVKQMTEGGKI